MRLLRLMAVAGAAVAVSSCGSSSGTTSDTGMGTPPKVPAVTQFPKVGGRTMQQVAASMQQGPVLAPTESQLIAGSSVRFGFGLFDRSRKQITDAPGAIYIARSLNAKAEGPYTARSESLAVQPKYLSKTVGTDPNAAKTLYAADLPFKHAGKYLVLGVFRLDNRLVGAGLPVQVQKTSKIPQPGEPAPKISTPTVASVGGNIAKIDTRQPHDDMHDVNYASVLGKKPIVLVFATPALCQSRVCGPVVDITEQVKHSRPDSSKFAWIHMEIYNNNNLSDGYRPQLLAFHLQTEPWLFTIDKRGKIAAVIEGAFSANELNKAVSAALK